MARYSVVCAKPPNPTPSIASQRMKKLVRVLAFIDGLSSWSGKLISMLIFAMIAVLMWEVISRYVFDSPTLWAHETTRYIYGAHFMIGGAYTLYLGAHVNVDIFYIKLYVMSSGK